LKSDVWSFFSFLHPNARASFGGCYRLVSEIQVETCATSESSASMNFTSNN
jgi:hypothetical protein